MGKQPNDDCEVGIERLMCHVDVERKTGKIIKNVGVYRIEKLADEDDIESVYEREYYATTDDYEDIYLGNDKGDNVIIKERGWEI